MDGNPAAAIKQYGAIVSKYGKTDRAAAAAALVRMAECYRKTGDAEARKTYERVVREYPEQKEAVAEARAWLGGAAAPDTEMGTHRVWANAKSGGVSPDGRYIAYTNWDDGGNLAIHDLSSGVDRNITHEDAKTGNYAEEEVFTPDSRQIVYTWWTGGREKKGDYDIRIVGLDGSGERTILRSGEYATCVAAISPDGKLAAARLYRNKEKTSQIALISLDTGNLRVLKNLEELRPFHGDDIGNFSPDGRWLVCSDPFTNGSPENKVYAIATDRSSESTLVPVAGVSGTAFYTPDGSRVVFTTDRSGRKELWSVRVADGKPLDAPELVKADIGKSFQGIGFSKDGSFYFEQSVSRSGVYVAEVDPATWKLRAAPKQVSDGFRDLNVASPAWSPDGKSLAYVSNPPSGTGRGEATFVIRNADSGQRKEVSAHFDNVATAPNFRWFADSKSLLLNGPPAPRLLDLGTGRDRVLFNKRVGGATSSPDGRTLFYTTTDADMDSSAPLSATNALHLLRRDLETGQEKELYRNEAAWISNSLVSPDGRTLAFSAGLPLKKLWLLPTSGGEPSELNLPAGTIPYPRSIAWAPDSKSVIFFGMSGMRIWTQPIDGGEPHGIRIVPPDMLTPDGPLSMLPDGRIAFAATVSTDEVWVLKNSFASSRAAK